MGVDSMSAPMELQRALEDGIEACDYLGRCGHHDSAKFRQATATLRAAMPFVKAAEAWAIHCGPLDDRDLTLSAPEFVAVIRAYRAMKEAK